MSEFILAEWREAHREATGSELLIAVDPETWTIHRWTGSVWEDIHRELTRIVFQETGHSVGKREADDLLQHVENMGTLLTGDRHELGSAQPWINFANGVYDLSTGELHPHGEVWNSVNQIPWEFTGDNPETYNRSEPLNWFLIERATGEDHAFLWQLLGAALLPGNPREHLYILSGPSGSGKSTYLEILRRATGPSNVETLNLSQLRDRFSPGYLHGALANVAGDVNGGTVKAYELLLGLTGGDQISADIKYRDRVKFSWDGKLLLATNGILTPPSSAGVLNGWWRRAQTIRFPYQVPEGERVSKRELMERIAPDEAMPAIVSRAAITLSAALREGHALEPTYGMRQAGLEVQMDGSSTRAWAKDRLLPDSIGSMKGRLLYEDYVEWCEAYGRKHFGARKFYTELEVVLPEIVPGGHRRQGRASESRAMFAGIKFDPSTLISVQHSGSRNLEEETDRHP